MASEACWVYSMFQLSSSRLADSKEMYSLRGAPPVVLGAAVPEAAEFAVPLLELLPPHADSRPAAPMTPAPLRKLRRSSL